MLYKTDGMRKFYFSQLPCLTTSTLMALIEPEKTIWMLGKSKTSLILKLQQNIHHVQLIKYIFCY